MFLPERHEYDADINKNLCADNVLSGDGNVSFQSVKHCDADTPENLYDVVPWTMMGSSLAVSVLSHLTLAVCHGSLYGVHARSG